MFFFQYDIDDIVKMELRQVLLFIIKDELVFSNQFESKEFIHLYEFQKFYLSKSLDGLSFLVKMKQKLDWNEFENTPLEKRSKYFQYSKTTNISLKFDNNILLYLHRHQFRRITFSRC